MGLFKRKQKPKDDNDNIGGDEFEQLDNKSDEANDIMARLQKGADDAQRQLEEQRRKREQRRNPCGCWG